MTEAQTEIASRLSQSAAWHRITITIEALQLLNASPSELFTVVQRALAPLVDAIDQGELVATTEEVRTHLDVALSLLAVAIAEPVAPVAPTSSINGRPH